ncbi:hypothetical protein Ciccas_013965, partial [Cichlidogyrus casuarinus]
MEQGTVKTVVEAYNVYDRFLSADANLNYLDAPSSSTASINAIASRKPKKFKPGNVSKEPPKRPLPPFYACKGCGGKHLRRDCPHYNEKCLKCGIRGHLKSMCYTKSASSVIATTTKSCKRHVLAAINDKQ